MPENFNACVEAGGKVRTKNVQGGRYIHYCIPPDGGPSVSGEVKEKQMEPTGGPAGRIYTRKVGK
jgi:hypothetical protein